MPGDGKHSQPSEGYPDRGDGGQWRPHMHVVARERSLGATWSEAADAADLSTSTVQKYPGRYPGWADLVEYYRRQAFDERIDEHLTEGSIEALDALRHEFRDAADQLREMEAAAEAGELPDDDREAAHGLSKAAVYAASQYLEATGRKKYQKTLAKLRAQQEVTGEAGERVNLKHALQDLEDLETDELASAYRQIVADPGEG